MAPGLRHPAGPCRASGTSWTHTTQHSSSAAHMQVGTWLCTAAAGVRGGGGCLWDVQPWHAAICVTELSAPAVFEQHLLLRVCI
jgi:hypothetical protein